MRGRTWDTLSNYDALGHLESHGLRGRWLADGCHPTEPRRVRRDEALRRMEP